MSKRSQHRIQTIITSGLAAVLAIGFGSPVSAAKPAPKAKKRITTKGRAAPRALNSKRRYALRANRAKVQARMRERARKNKEMKVYKTPCNGLEVLTKHGREAFGIGEELAYELSIAGAYVGRLEMKVGKPRRVNGKMVIPLFGRARTSSFVGAFKDFEGRYMSLVDPVTLAPVGVRVESKYGEEERNEKIQFSDKQRKVVGDYTLKGREGQRNYQGTHDLTDVLTLVYATRRVSMYKGLEGCQDAFGARRLWRMDAKVLDVVDINTKVGKKTAYRVSTKFDRKPVAGLNNVKRPHFEVELFYAKDKAQTPLMFKVDTDGVVAEGKLVRWKIDGGDDDNNWQF